MAKKQVQRGRIDEALILNLIGGVDAPPRLVPKPAPAAEPPETPPPESGPSATVQEPSPTTPLGHKDGTAKGTGYEQIFLHPRKFSPDTTCRIERGLREKLRLIVRMLGGDEMTLKGYINNIVESHLKQYRNEINELLKNSKIIKL